jgi:hypothetical protein
MGAIMKEILTGFGGDDIKDLFILKARQVDVSELQALMVWLRAEIAKAMWIPEHLLKVEK